MGANPPQGNMSTVATTVPCRMIVITKGNILAGRGNWRSDGRYPGASGEDAPYRYSSQKNLGHVNRYTYGREGGCRIS